jgi:DNA-binding PadR family transcriptional regulator
MRLFSRHNSDGHGHRHMRGHGRHPFGHGFHRGGRGGLGRFFAHGDLKLVILSLIAEKPRHGYEIIKAIEDRVAGAYSPSPGVIYPTLTLLEELGYATVSDGDGGKKLHAITDQGRAFLDANRTTLEALLARMAEAGRANESSSAPQILRAMENLKMALRLRLSRGPLNDEQATALAAALDAAAQAVERI